MKCFTTIIILCFAFVATAQIKKGTITYQFSISDSIINKANNLTLLYNVSFNNGTYFYKPQSKNIKPKSIYETAILSICKTLGLNDEYYFENTKAKGLRVNTEFDSTYILETEDNNSYLKAFECKEIIGFTCYKAYNIKIVADRNKNGSDSYHQEKTIVWYTKQLPVNMGPANFRNLAGTILEVEFFNGSKIKATHFSKTYTEKIIKCP